MSDPNTTTDAKAQELRERAMDLLAASSVHVERITAAAARLGLTPDVLDGVGDQLYAAAVAQLDIAAKVLESSQQLAARLFELGTRREPRPLIRIDVTCREPGHLRFVVRNGALVAGDLEIAAQWDGPRALSAAIGRRRLDAGRQTSVEIAIPTADLEAGRVYAGTARIWLSYAALSPTELPPHDFEIWVAA